MNFSTGLNLFNPPVLLVGGAVIQNKNRKSKRWKYVPIVGLGVMAVLVLLNWTGVLVMPWQDRDRLLLEAVQENNLFKFKRLLEGGANPNRVFGTKPEDWVMCEVADKGRLAFLKAAQAHGGDIHMRNTEPPIQVSLNAIFSAPLLCAISMHSYVTFKYLLDQGADTRIRVFTGAKPKNRHVTPAIVGKTLYDSPITVAGTNYRMVYDMMLLRPLSWEEKWSLKNKEINPRGIDRKSEAYRVWWPKVLAMAKQQGLDEIDLGEPSDEAKRLGIGRSEFWEKHRSK